ncbi:hypothetical protein BB560_004700 [Smittium megazygosporum]|uniref:Uncharacterized protein n=1 Tax=Smittium megazygosporum TaxID=133381 RepID=A0A2T9Z8M8_9FUNG|nr:hypothetical protein BB560_004700 [Smittium megazygosporum]
MNWLDYVIKPDLLKELANLNNLGILVIKDSEANPNDSDSSISARFKNDIYLQFGPSTPQSPGFEFGLNVDFEQESKGGPNTNDKDTLESSSIKNPYMKLLNQKIASKSGFVPQAGMFARNDKTGLPLFSFFEQNHQIFLREPRNLAD